MSRSRSERFSGRSAGMWGVIWFCGALFIAIFMLSFWSDNAKAQLTCDVVQVTDTTSGETFAGFLNADGTLGAFASDADINGGNPDGSFEAYIFDTDTLVITQLTDSVGLNSFALDISQDGTLIGLSSEADLSGGNPDGNREIFLYDIGAMTFTQITDTTGENNIVPALNSDGTLIAIDSAADLTGGNPDNNREIFLFDDDTAMFTQLTDTTAGDSLVPSITPDGETIAFHSNSDLTGDNMDGSLEVFLYFVMSDTFSQITNGVGENSARPSLSSDGSVIALNSDTNPTGTNPDGNREIFLFDTNTLMFTQVSESTGVNNSDPFISSDGNRVTFRSSADLTGENPDNNTEVYQFDANTGMTEQLTDTPGPGIEDLETNSDGRSLLFSSTSNITGENPDGSDEIYFAGCRIVAVNGTGGGGGCVIAGNPDTKISATNLAVLILPLLVIGLMRFRRKIVASGQS